MNNNLRCEDYPFEIRPLSQDEGGGFAISFPDLPGCMSDGETVEDAIANGRDAFAGWMEAHIEDGRPVPAPNARAASGRFLQRLPKTLHARLSARAEYEGVSLNTLAATFIAEGLGRRDAP